MLAATADEIKLVAFRGIDQRVARSELRIGYA